MRKASVFVLFMILATPLFAQQAGLGRPPYGTFQSGKFDDVNLENLNVVFSIPIVSMHGRGLGTSFSISYNSAVWSGATYWTPSSGFGWNYDQAIPQTLYSQETVICEASQETADRFFDFVAILPDGTAHSFGGELYSTATYCNFPTGSTEGLAGDGSGWAFVFQYYGGLSVYSPSGHTVTYGALYDSNGNYNSTSGLSTIDTLGRAVLTIVPYTNYREFQVKDVNGGVQTYTLNFGTYNIKTGFGCPGEVEYTLQNWKLPSSLVLSNGQSYTFTYEDTPGWAGWITARLKRVTLPTGGYYEYTYPDTQGRGMSCTGYGIMSLTRTVNDGTYSYSWDYSRAQTEMIMWPNYNYGRQTWKTTVTHPQLAYDSARNQSTYSFMQYGVNDSHPFNASGERTQRHYLGLESSNQLLRTVNVVYGWWKQPLTTYLILENGQQSKTEVDSNEDLQITETREYDWGSGAPGGLLRKTTNTYLTGGEYSTRKIRDRITQTIVRDGAGNIQSRTEIAYDTTSLACVTGATHHDDSGHGCSVTARGNPTSTTQYTDPVTPSGAITATSTYDSLGNVTSVTDPGGHTTNFSYADNFSDGVNRNTYAFLTHVTKPSPFNAQTLSTKYYYDTGAEHSVTGENSRVTSFSYLDGAGNPDKFNRLRKTTFPDGGETFIDYNDYARTVTTTQKRTGTESVSSTDAFNPLAQLTQSQLPGNRKIDYAYDAWGRQWKVTNPYVSTGESTYGIAETQFDALGRVKKTIAPDSTYSQVEYQGNAVRSTDASGKQMIAQSDGIGRLTRVCEVTAGNTRSPSESCGMTGFGGTGYLTTVSYSVSSGQSVSTSTQGSQTRTQKVDGAGRMIASRITEVSTATDVTYGYDADSNQTSVTDPKGTVYFEYDALHRLIRKKHGTTVVAEFSYDGTQANNAIGRLITETDGVTGSGADKTQYTYDTMGRVLTANRTVSSTTYNMSYTYDLLGNLTVLNYPSSSGTRRKVDYAYVSTGELNKVSDTTGTAFDYVTATTYSPLGPMSQLDLGNGVRTTPSWNNSGEMSSLVTNKVGGSTYLNLTYAYNGNGQIQQITDSLNGNKTWKYSYDELKRLLTAQRGPDASPATKYSYDYDRYGNRWAQTVIAGTGYGGTNTFNAANNHITTSGFSYSESGVDRGNLAAVSPASYTYNPESMMTAVGGSVSYVYDAQNRRVKKTMSGTTTDYFYSGSELIAEKTGSAWTDYIFYGDARIAQQTAGPATPGTGSTTVSGSEQSVGGSAATPGTGSATVSGSEQSIPGAGATPGTGSVNITGSEQSWGEWVYLYDECVLYGDEGCLQWRSFYTWVDYYDYGGVSITVNGFTKSASFVSNSTGSSIASALASAFNGDGASPATASVNGTVVNLTSKATGTASNYSLSATSWTDDPGHFSGPSFVPVGSGPMLTGGTNSTPTVYDSGSVWVTVNGSTKTVTYGQGSTNTSVATALRDAINGDGNYPVSASLSGPTINLTARTTGASTNYSLSGGSSTSQPASFSQPSFTVSVSGSTLTGGADAGPLTYDSGSVWITVNGMTKTVSYGQSSTATSVATALRDAMYGDETYPVSAILAGTTLTLTARTSGASTNYSLTKGSSTNLPGSFSQPSFTVATSGSTLTGGADAGGATASTAVYLHTDHLGSTRVCTDANGNSTGACDYEPFGEVQPGTSCSVPTAFRFAGMQWDSETGLYHTWFRKYDSNQARWMSVDPKDGAADQPQSFDRYAYVLNDPVNLTDPTGLQAPGVTCYLDQIETPCGMIFDRMGVKEFDLLRDIFAIDNRIVGLKMYGYWDGDCSQNGDCAFKVGFAPIYGSIPSQLWDLLGWLREFTSSLARQNLEGWTSDKGCENQFWRAAAASYITPGTSSLGPVAGAYLQGSNLSKAISHAASAKNYLGGTGLMFPMKSSVVRGYLTKARQGNAIGQMIQLNIALGEGLAAEVSAMRQGNCR